MPIRQLKSKSSGASSGFSTHQFGTGSHDVASRRSAARNPVHSSSWNTTPRSASGSGGQSPKKSRRRKKVLASRLLKLALLILLMSGIGIVTLFAYYSKDLPDPNKIIQRDVAQSTKIYDRTGKVLLYEIHGTERRTSIELSDIPQYAKDATIAIEDKNFFKHKGLSFPSILKAMVLDIASKLHLYNGLVPGGSTLTQQFIKNAVLTTEKSYTRKIKEFVLAYRLEQKFTKEQILKLYFNEIPYGSTAYGIEAASHIYFDKSAKDLTLGEAAVLAAMPQAPSYYSPYGSHRDELIGRQRLVLKLMVDQGYITQEQAQAARDEKIVFKKKREDIKAPHFVFMVKEELSQRYGDRLVEQGGLKIITTLDYDKQKIAEDTINEIGASNLEKYKAQNASLVTIDVNSGQVLALVGSRDYFDDSIDGQVNVATSPRQPGSSLKPLVYSEAFNRGYRPDSMIFDLRTQFSSDYSPQDYDGKERGPLTLRSALQGSLNIPAVKMLYLIGVPRAIELAKELGYTTLLDPDRYGLSLVLGGGEVKLIEHTNAYATFAREGVYKPYADVLSVQDASGATLEQYSDTEGKRVLPKEVTRQLSNVLSDNDARTFIFGASNHLVLDGRPVAAKTGTTNNYKDAWTMGYTPSIVTGVWVGNSDNTSMGSKADGSVVAAPIWQKYMNAILKDTPAEVFKAPEPLDPCTKPMLCGTLGSEHVIKINMDNGKLAGPATPPSKIKEVTYKEVHEILQYVDKNDPTGPEPADPSADPQYSAWEGPVQQWAQKEGYLTDAPPTDVDTTYRPEDQPSVTWISPQANAIISAAPISLAAQAIGPHGISKVTFLLNGQVIGSASQPPFTISYTPNTVLQNGIYTLSARAADSLGNEGESNITVSINVPRGPNDWFITWGIPQSGAAYTLASLPAELQVNIENPQRVKKIDFYYKQDGSPHFIGYQDVNGQSQVRLSWVKPVSPGNYELYLVVTDINGQTLTHPSISISVTS